MTRTLTVAAVICLGFVWQGCKRTPADPSAQQKIAAPQTAAAPSLAKQSSGSAASQEVTPQKTATAAPSQAIRAADLKPFVEQHLGDLNPDLADLATECGEGQKLLQSLAPPEYGDLDGDGSEEAVVQGWSCLSGNGGSDFWGVLGLAQDGKITILPIEPLPKKFKGRNTYDNLRGHIKVEIKESRLVMAFPLYPDENACNSCSDGERRFVYRWNGHEFVLDDMMDLPPDKAEN